MKLEDLQHNASVRGILPDELVAVVSVQWFGSEALELTYKSSSGKVANELLYRHDEPRLEIVVDPTGEVLSFKTKLDKNDQGADVIGKSDLEKLRLSTFTTKDKYSSSP